MDSIDIDSKENSEKGRADKTGNIRAILPPPQAGSSFSGIINGDFTSTLKLTTQVHIQ